MRYQREHMENEERVFFPAALHALTAEDWAELQTRMTDQEDPLFGDNVGERYEALHMDILRWEREERTT
jgi:hemerythrin-like domain-containing protein